MDDWKRRLINEEKELKYKIDKLYRFLKAADRDGASDIDSENLLLMLDQLDAMVRYDLILRKRMELYHLIVEVKLDGR